MPVVTVNGKRMGQQKAYLRYLGTKLGCYDPKDAKGAYQQDVAIEATDPLFAAFVPMAFGKTEEAKAEGLKGFCEAIDGACCFTEARMKKHGWSHTAGNDVCLSDFTFARWYTDYAINTGFAAAPVVKAVYDKHPALQPFLDAFVARMKSHLDSRGVAPF